MKRLLIAGNWKMNLDLPDAAALAEGVARGARELNHVDLLVCPSSIHLGIVADKLGGGKPGDGSVALGAQNMYHEANGAYTGEISARMLLDVGCQYVILGHSERRHVLGETDEDVNRKTHAALAAGLRPIVCVGELLSEREAGQTADVIRRQFDGSLAGVEKGQMAQVTIAYEPVWAIGTGKVATPAEAGEVHDDLRKVLADRYNVETACRVRILYGGSVNPGNAGDLLAMDNIDGALVGGASLKSESFLSIAAAAPA